MEIGLFYSMQNSEHRKAVSLVKKAVRNLGIQANITEMDSVLPTPRILVDGFELPGFFDRSGKKPAPKPSRLSYDQIEQALESTAW